MMEIKSCPITLAEGHSTYSKQGLVGLFSGHKVPHLLPYKNRNCSEETIEAFLNNRKFISISGVQEKESIVQTKTKLRLSKAGEQGTHILKPIPAGLKLVKEVPANEHLTMQIARQVYKIDTAANGLIFFEDGEPAYITKRFDIKQDGMKWGKEDFASLAQKTSQNAGPNFKYEYSYEEMAELLRKFVPAWKIDIERFFCLVLFNYLLSNGDAHLKNFGLLESPAGDYRLSPAYDLINSNLHVDDSAFALSKGLFADDYKSETWKKYGNASQADFREFAKRIGVTEQRLENLIAPFLEKQGEISQLISRSYLTESSKRGYLLRYQTRFNQFTK